MENIDPKKKSKEQTIGNAIAKFDAFLDECYTKKISIGLIDKVHCKRCTKPLEMANMMTYQAPRMRPVIDTMLEDQIIPLCSHCVKRVFWKFSKSKNHKTDIQL